MGNIIVYSFLAKQFAGRKARAVFEPTIKVEGLRNRKRGTSAESAIELKEKRSRTQVCVELYSLFTMSSKLVIMQEMGCLEQQKKRAK